MSGNYARNGKYINDSARVDGKLILITGANAGIGRATAEELARRGGKIYFACRSEERGLKAVNEVKELTGNPNIIFIQLDLASLENIRDFSRRFHELESRIDILINNAGVLSPKGETKDGFELNMGINHLGHFLLTNLLLDLLKEGSRVIVVASELHRIGNIVKDNMVGEKSFPGVVMGYANSKLANVLFAQELAVLVKDKGVTVNALCPGPVDTDVTHSLNFFMKTIMIPVKKLFYKSPKDGAQTLIMLAVEPEIKDVTGEYFEKCATKQPKQVDDEISKWLWKHSEKLTGLNSTGTVTTL